MFDHKHRRPYWLETRRLMVFVLMTCAVLLLCGLVFVDQLNGFTFIGFPVGYFLLAHGFIMVGFALFVWNGHEQDYIDHRHGTHEDI